MKRYIGITGLTLALCSLAAAQDAAGERVVVPARNTTRPRVLNVHLTHGSVAVKTHAGKDVIVESKASPTRQSGERTVDGLRRIELPPRGLSVEEDDNVIDVRTGGMSHNLNLTITVPPDTSLHLKSSNGDVSAEGVRGEVEATSSNGEIRLLNISGTVIASSSNGTIKVTMDRVDPAKPLSFSSNNGDVDVTLPADFKANVKLRSLHGSVYSDFEMKLTGQPSALRATATTTAGGKDGKFRVVFDQTIYGTINGGGVEASFNTLNGRILIRKK